MKRLVGRLLPRNIRHAIRERIKQRRQPKMLWGYVDKNGMYREKTRISDTAYIYHPENVNIEDNVFIGHYTIIDGTAEISIGEGVQIAAWGGIFTHSSHISIRLLGRSYQDFPEGEKPGYLTAPVHVGRYAFIGARAIIMPGVTIGQGALIRAGSLVTRDVPPFAIVQGSPGNIVGDTRQLDEQYIQSEEIRRMYEEWQQ